MEVSGYGRLHAGTSTYLFPLIKALCLRILQFFKGGWKGGKNKLTSTNLAPFWWGAR